MLFMTKSKCNCSENNDISFCFVIPKLDSQDGDNFLTLLRQILGISDTKMSRLNPLTYSLKCALKSLYWSRAHQNLVENYLVTKRDFKSRLLGQNVIQVILKDN